MNLLKFCRFYVVPFVLKGKTVYCSCCFQNIFSFYDYSYINLDRLYLWLTLKIDLIYHIIAVEPEEIKEKSNAGAVAAGVVLSLLVFGIIVAALYFFR